MSPLQHNSSSAVATGQEFSREERDQLLRLAHDSISSALQQREISLDPPTYHLAEPRGAFTSLHLRGELRGCVGYVLPTSPVYRAVAETARAAAFNDNRFPPVTSEENPNLEIESCSGGGGRIDGRSNNLRVGGAHGRRAGCCQQVLDRGEDERIGRAPSGADRRAQDVRLRAVELVACDD